MKNEDIALRKFGRWTAVIRSLKNTSDGKSMWECVCECGTERTVAAWDLARGKSKSCGCAMNRDGRRTHGKTGTPEHNAWCNMRKYHLEVVCPEWNDFSVFLKDVGKKQSKLYRLMRIDKDKPFSKTNCMWVKRGEMAIIKAVQASKGQCKPLVSFI
jgi:hypothetical protein